jgi:hypothetical protein
MRRALRLHAFSLLSLLTAACGQSGGGTTTATGGSSPTSSGGNAQGGSSGSAATTGGMPAATGGTTAATGGASAITGGASAITGGVAGSAAGSIATGGAAAGSASAALLPFKVGNSWTYRVTDDDGVSTKVTTVEAMEAVGGTGPSQAAMAYRVVTKKGADSADQTISWQAPVGDKVVRYREQSFGATTQMLKLEEHWDPYKLHIDGSAEHTVMGASWVETYVETKLPVGEAAASATNADPWSVVSASEMVQVPAGTFDAVVFEKSGNKRYWYARGIGKVKEAGSQTEELTAYKLQ